MMNKNQFILFFSFQLFFLNQDLNAPFVFTNPEAKIRVKSSGKLILEATLTINDGTIELTSPAATTIQGNDIVFQNGRLKTQELTSVFTGNYNATGSDQINLTGGHSIDVTGGSIPVPINVSGVDNSILGRLYLDHEITMASGSELKMEIETALNKNINLNSGVLSLSSDLKMGESVQLIGPGTINCAGNRVSFGTYPLVMNQDLIFANNANIELSSDITLNNCSWTFSDVGGTTYINGNNNTLDLGANSSLIVANDHTIYLNNIRIKGLGDGLTEGKIIFGNNTGIARMKDVSLYLVNNYTLDLGNFYIYGSNSYVSVGSYSFNISSLANLTVDGVALVWDRLSLNNDTNPVIPVAGTNLTLIGSGFIRSINSSISPVSTYSNNSALSANVDITTSSNLTFSNANPLVRKVVTLSGNGHFVQFSRNDSNHNFIVQDNIDLTFSNIVFKDFNPASISLGVDSTITFADDVTLEVGKDLSINTQFYFKGNVVLNGKGHKITLNHDDSLVLDAAGKNLKLQNLILCNPGGNNVGNGLGRIRCNEATASITFQDVNVFLDDDYVLAQGSFIINDNCKFSGDSKIFTLTSSSQSQILSQSSWHFDIGTTFSYAADVGVLPENGTSASYQQSRNRLFFEDESSTLCLEAATLHMTHTGLLLETGTILIKDHSVLKSVAGQDEGPYGHGAPTTGEEPVIKDSFIIKILSAAVCDIQGKIIHS